MFKINYDTVVNIQRVCVENDGPVIVSERTDEDISSYRDDLANLVSDTSTEYFTDTVQRVLDTEEIISNRQTGALVKIRMMYTC